MKPSTLIAFTITIFVAHIVTADLSSDRVSDAWAAYYKQYYEEHNDVNDRDSGYHAPSTSYDSPSVSYDSPSYVTSYGGYKSTPFDLLKPHLDPETAALVAFAALALGAINLIGFVTLDQRVKSLEDDQDSICTAVRGLGSTTFAASVGANVAALSAEMNTIIGQLNAVATPDCQ